MTPETGPNSLESQRISTLQRLAAFDQAGDPQHSALLRQLDHVYRKATRNLQPGSWNRCESPPETLYGPVGRCRKCQPCLRVKAHEWQKRAYIEFRKHERTWFVTLTYNKSHINGAKYAHFQTWIKSLKDQDHEISYMTAQEFGTKTGRYHIHVLLHCSRNVTKSVIRYRRKKGPQDRTNARWKYGYVDMKLTRHDLKGETYDKWHTVKKYQIREQKRLAKRQGKQGPQDSKPLGKYLAKYFGGYKKGPDGVEYEINTSKISASQGYGKDPENEWKKGYYSDKFKAQTGWLDPKGRVIEQYMFCPQLQALAIHAYPAKVTRNQRISRIRNKVERLSTMLYPKMSPEGPMQLVYPDIQDQFRRLLPYFKTCALKSDKDHPLFRELPEHRAMRKYQSGIYSQVKVTPTWKWYGGEALKPIPPKFKIEKFIGPTQPNSLYDRLRIASRHYTGALPI